VQVARGGADVVVAQPLLQAVQIDAGLQQMGGVAMAQAVDAAVPALGLLHMQRPGLAGARAEQPLARPAGQPVAAQQRQQIVGQRHVAIAPALALHDVHAHAVASAVDVLRAQRAQLAHAQAQGIGATQQHVGTQVMRARQQGRDLGAREDLRQALQLRGQRNLERLAVQPEHGAVEKAERAAVLVDAGARQMALAHEVQQVLLDLVRREQLGTAGVVPRQP